MTFALPELLCESWNMLLYGLSQIVLSFSPVHHNQAQDDMLLLMESQRSWRQHAFNDSGWRRWSRLPIGALSRNTCVYSHAWLPVFNASISNIGCSRLFKPQWSCSMHCIWHICGTKLVQLANCGAEGLIRHWSQSVLKSECTLESWPAVDTKLSLSWWEWPTALGDLRRLQTSRHLIMWSDDSRSHVDQLRWLSTSFRRAHALLDDDLLSWLTFAKPDVLLAFAQANPVALSVP